MKGAGDPTNRAALWANGGYTTSGSTYALIKKLNGIRKGLANGTRFHNEIGSVIGNSDNDIAVVRNKVLIALTKVCPILLCLPYRSKLMRSEEKADRELGL